MKKRLLSLLLVFVMVISMLPATALAAGPQDNGKSVDVYFYGDTGTALNDKDVTVNIKGNDYTGTVAYNEHLKLYYVTITNVTGDINQEIPTISIDGYTVDEGRIRKYHGEGQHYFVYAELTASSSGETGGSSETSTTILTFKIVGGTWTSATSSNNYFGGTLSQDGTELTFVLSYNSSIEAYVYPCSDGGHSGPNGGPDSDTGTTVNTAETFFNTIANSSMSSLYTPSAGYGEPGDWTVSGGIKGSTASASAQITTVANNKHGYDDNQTPHGGFVANTVYTYTLTRIPTYTVTYSWSGLPEGATVSVPTDGNEYRAGDAVTINNTFTSTSTTTVGYDKYIFSGWTVSPELNNGKMPAYNVTVTGTWELDNWNDEKNTPTGGDGIPDKYQAKVIFKVVNGNWNDGTEADILQIVTLTKDGEYAEDGTYALTAEDIPAVGEKPDDGFKAGKWDTTLAVDTEVTADAIFTYTYQKTIGELNPIYVAYRIEHYLEQKDGTYELKDTDLPADYAEVGTTASVKASDYNEYEGYAFDSGAANVLSADVIEPSVTDGELSITTLKLYYSIDELNDKENLPTGGDGVPDKYQAKVIFKVVNGNWNDGTEADILQIVTLTKDGEYAEDGTYALTAEDIPAVGEKPDTGFEAGEWDTTLAVGTEVTADTTFTYTYQKTIGELDPIYAAYRIEHYLEQEDGTYELEDTDLPADYAVVGTTASVKASDYNEYEGYAFDSGAANVLSADVIEPSVTDGELSITTLKLYYSIDELNDENNTPTGGDGVPDKYQAKVIFKVVNGNWNDETEADILQVVTLTKNGEYAEDGTYALTAEDIPAVGEKPDTGFEAGEWDTTLAVGTEVTADTTFTYTYQKTIGELDPIYAAYRIEHYLEQEDGTYELEDTDLPADYAVVGTTASVKASDYNEYEGYAFDSGAANVLSADVIEPSVTDGELSITTLKLYYSKDELNDKENLPTGGDGIPDKYQVLVNYVSANTNQGTAAPAVEVLTIYAADGKTYAASGAVTASGSTATANNGYSFVKWTNDAGLADVTTANLGEQTFNAVGGKTYTFTASFETVYTPPYIPPVVPPVAPPVLNYEDHLSYIIGYEDGTVRPEGTITRAEVATIFFRLLSDESRELFWSTENPFSDVAADKWFNNAISTMYNAGIVTGYPDGTFRPNAPVTRAEFAAIAARFSDIKETDGKTNFLDLEKEYWAYTYIELAEELGWVQGYQGYFRPMDNMTRAEVMTTVNRVLKRAVEEDGMLEGMIEWPDCQPGDWFYEDVQEATNSHTYYRTGKLVDKVGSYQPTYYYEKWTALIENPDWAALEKDWSAAVKAADEQ